jgi:acid phosphatase family membrane protein YuiD
MDWLSPYLIAIVIAWVVVNLIKLLIDFAKKKRLSKQPIFSTGGMPSAHTAPMVALATIIALIDGVGSVGFAISFLFAIVVMTDAVHVRRAVGEQGIALKKLLKKADKEPYIAKGHNLIEVIVGALIGLVVAIATYYLTMSC